VPAVLTARQNLYEAAPPLYAYAASRLADSGRLADIPESKLSAFCGAMSKTVGWWLKYRTNDAGLCYYAYRHECGWPGERLFPAGTPAATPDLAAYILLAAETLSTLFARLDRLDEAAAWNVKSRQQLDILTRELWDGDRFRSVNALTGQSGPAESILSLIPLILGKRLPESILAVLAEQAKNVSWEMANLIPASLVILGLEASGYADQAGAACKRLVGSCAAGGANDARGRGISSGAFYSPAACAALLAAGGRNL
jgi:glycogen debranching enzyme